MKNALKRVQIARRSFCLKKISRNIVKAAEAAFILRKKAF